MGTAVVAAGGDVGLIDTARFGGGAPVPGAVEGSGAGAGGMFGTGGGPANPGAGGGLGIGAGEPIGTGGGGTAPGATGGRAGTPPGGGNTDAFGAPPPGCGPHTPP